MVAALGDQRQLQPQRLQQAARPSAGSHHHRICLQRAAAKLPNVAVERPACVIGTSTVPAMQSGIYWGYVGLVEGIIGRIKQEFGQPMLVISTGGLSPLFAKATAAIEHPEPDLTIYGLNVIYNMNK